jgi:hypothetical protein
MAVTGIPKSACVATAASAAFPLMPLRAFGLQGKKSFDAAVSNAKSVVGNGATAVPPEKQREYDDMQVGMYADQIKAERAAAAAFLALPREEQIRQYMLKKGKFDVDLVRKNGMDVKSEFDLFRKQIEKAQKRASRSFWVPMTLCTFVITCGPLYMIFCWY